MTTYYKPLIKWTIYPNLSVPTMNVINIPVPAIFQRYPHLTRIYWDNIHIDNINVTRSKFQNSLDSIYGILYTSSMTKDFILPAAKKAIDTFIQEGDKHSGFTVCPESQRKSYYLKACHVLFCYQRAYKIEPTPAIQENISTVKNWLPYLRAFKE